MKTRIAFIAGLLLMVVLLIATSGEVSSVAQKKCTWSGGCATPTPTPPPSGTTTLEAENGTIVAPMAIQSDALAFNGQYVRSLTQNEGTVTFAYTAATTTNYYIWARVLAPDFNKDSFTVLVDGADSDVYDVAEGTLSTSWQWSRVVGRGGTMTPGFLNPRVFALTAGAHTFTFTGRDPDTKLDQIVITADVGFMPSGAPTPTPTPTPIPGGTTLELEAESATIFAPMSAVLDATASNGQYVVSNTEAMGRVTFTFTTEADDYYVWCLIRSIDSGQDSFFVEIDGADEDVYDTAEGTWNTEWQWSRINGRGGPNIPLTINPRIFTLTAGQHSLEFRGRDPGTRLDKIIITDDPAFAPPGVTPPASPTPTPTPTPTPDPGGPTPIPTPTPTPGPTPEGAARYVSTTGSGAACTFENPCSLDKAFSTDGDNPVVPGDTVYLRGGRYFKNTSHPICNSTLWCARRAGTVNAPITYRSYPGEVATLDTTEMLNRRLLTIVASYTIFRDLELTMTSYWPGPYAPACTTDVDNPPYIGPRHQCGNWKQTQRGRGNATDVDTLPGFPQTTGVKILNNLIHDAGQGMFAGVAAAHVEFYGNIVFYNGGSSTYFEDGQWHGPSGHGHGVYIQTDTGMRISDNVFLGQWNFGIHAYGTNVAPLTNMVIDRNIAYGSGAPVGVGNPNLLIGSGQPIIDGKVRDNHFYRRLAAGGGSNCQFGYFFASGVLNESITITGNRCIGGDFAAQVTSYKDLTLTGNHIYANGNTLMFLNQYDSAIPYRSGYLWNNNTYISTNQTNVFLNEQNLFTPAYSTWRGTFAQWKTQFGFDTNSTFSQTMPITNQVFIYLNEYEPGGANIVIYNWSLQDTINIDLTGTLAIGKTYEIRNAEKMLTNSQQSSGTSTLATPIASGTWGGTPITINLKALTPSIPVGSTSAPNLHGIEFAVLRLRCTNC